MTLIAAWVSMDDKPQGKSPSAIYIGSDSRYTWPGLKNYEYGQKTFGCLNSPEIFGFCGDVMFPLNVINQLVSLIDSGCLFRPEDTSEVKISQVMQFINDAYTNYPFHPVRFTIIYGTRCNGTFDVFRIGPSRDDIPEAERIPMPKFSDVMVRDGSGAEDFNNIWLGMDIEKNDNHATSRNMFHCLSEAIHNGRDKQTGGQPQTVALYRGGNGRIIGFSDDRNRYLYGRETGFEYPKNLDAIEWRNSSFERIDPKGLSPLKDATRHYFRPSDVKIKP